MALDRETKMVTKFFKTKKGAIVEVTYPQKTLVTKREKDKQNEGETVLVEKWIDTEAPVPHDYEEVSDIKPSWKAEFDARREVIREKMKKEKEKEKENQGKKK